MKELGKSHRQKDRHPATIAQSVVNMVVDFLKQKLPAPAAGQIDVVLKDEVSVKTAEDVLRNYASRLRKK